MLYAVWGIMILRGQMCCFSPVVKWLNMHVMTTQSYPMMGHFR